jgi:hypothetical protein
VVLKKKKKKKKHRKNRRPAAGKLAATLAGRADAGVETPDLL